MVKKVAREEPHWERGSQSSAAVKDFAENNFL
jgi:hypothetical protein